MYMNIIDYFLDKLSNFISFFVPSKEKKYDEKEYEFDPLLRI